MRKKRGGKNSKIPQNCSSVEVERLFFRSKSLLEIVAKINSSNKYQWYEVIGPENSSISLNKIWLSIIAKIANHFLFLMDVISSNFLIWLLITLSDWNASVMIFYFFF